jgi:hypothetical protein
MRLQLPDGAKQRETLENYITALTAVKNSYSGRQFEAQNPGIIRWPDLVPNSIRQMPFGSQIQNALRQLGGEAHSRGIRV